MTRNRILRFAAIGGGLVVVLGVAVAAFVSLKVPFDTNPSVEPSTGACDPQPCANVRGYIVWVSDLKMQNGVVIVMLRFTNSSASTHAAPEDFTLVDSQKNDHSAVFFAPDCNQWPRTEFNNGASYGPVPECFRLSSTSPPLDLRWTPDFGPFCCETLIKLD